MINRYSNFGGANGTYRGVDGNTYRMYCLICQAEAKESALERLNKLRDVVVEQPFVSVEGIASIDYCKREGEQ